MKIKAGSVPVSEGTWLLTVAHVMSEGNPAETAGIVVALSLPGCAPAYELSMTPAQARALAALLTAPVVPVL